MFLIKIYIKESYINYYHTIIQMCGQYCILTPPHSIVISCLIFFSFWDDKGIVSILIVWQYYFWVGNLIGLSSFCILFLPSAHLCPCSICHFCWQHKALGALDLIVKVSLPYYFLFPVFLWIPVIFDPLIPILVDVPVDFVPLEIGFLLLGIGLILLL